MDPGTPVGPTPSGSPPSDREICVYVAELCTELRRVARHPRFRTLGYLLDMVRLEAEKIAESLPE